MTLTALTRVATLAAMISGGASTAATAQTNTADPHHPDTTVVQTTPPAEPGDTAGQGQDEQSGGSRECQERQQATLERGASDLLPCNSSSNSQRLRLLCR
jgi:hypothetical protein